MDDEIDLAPLGLGGVKHRINGGGIGDVTVAEQSGAEFGSQRLDALLQRIALIGECDFGALGLARLGDAPGDGAIVGDTQNDTTLALHQA